MTKTCHLATRPSQIVWPEFIAPVVEQTSPQNITRVWHCLTRLNRDFASMAATETPYYQSQRNELPFMFFPGLADPRDLSPTINPKDPAIKQTAVVRVAVLSRAVEAGKFRDQPNAGKGTMRLIGTLLAEHSIDT